ncbi:MAG: hypothetical protein QM741_02710 [Rudaea sp.]|uniref:hypothetical protein n=1 Tax=Rudaea sp. TaxID=2136325 RepID=UPI0039E4FA01
MAVSPSPCAAAEGEGAPATQTNIDNATDSGRNATRLMTIPGFVDEARLRTWMLRASSAAGRCVPRLVQFDLSDIAQYIGPGRKSEVVVNQQSPL